MKDELMNAFKYALEVERELNSDKDSYKWELKGSDKKKNPYEDIRDFMLSYADPFGDAKVQKISKYSVMYPGIGMSNKKRLKLNNY